MLILSKNSVNTFVEAKKVPLFRDIGFAERERDLLFAYFSSFFPHVLLIDTTILGAKNKNVKQNKRIPKITLGFRYIHV